MNFSILQRLCLPCHDIFLIAPCYWVTSNCNLYRECSNFEDYGSSGIHQSLRFEGDVKQVSDGRWATGDEVEVDIKTAPRYFSAAVGSAVENVDHDTTFPHDPKR
jgi:hypothetical protein